jgi:ABC-type sugar transport system permease subunit
MRRKMGKEGRIAILFLVPLFAMYAIYFVYSFWFLFKTSFQKVDLSFSDAVQVGWRNYRIILEDPEFRRAVLNNLVFAATTIVIGLTLAFFIAVALSTGVRGRRAYLTIFLVPALTPVALIATIFGNMLEYDEGSLNSTLRTLGLGVLAQHWLTDSTWAFASVIGLFGYLIGLPIMYYTADLSAINTSVLEASMLDGAGPWRIMRSVLHPMMRSTHITVILALLLGSFRAFEVVLLSTGGGPNDSTGIVSTYTYAFFTSGGSTIGFASASSILVLVIALIVSGVQSSLLTRGERRVSRAGRKAVRAQRRQKRAAARRRAALSTASRAAPPGSIEAGPIKAKPNTAELVTEESPR